MSYSSVKKNFWRKTIKRYIVDAFGNKCHCCGKIFEDCCYDLHHTNSKEKDFTCSSQQFNGAKSWLKIRDEVCKCVLVCSNCHRLIHNGFLDNPEKSDFDMNYYDWELTKYKQVNMKLQPIDVPFELCPNCGNAKSPEAKLCMYCARENQRKLHISREELKKLIRKMTFVDIGKMFGVSDNTIRHQCKSYGLPFYSSIIKSLSDDEWKNECFHNVK